MYSTKLVGTKNGIVSLLLFVLTVVTFTYLLMYLSSVVTWSCQYFSVLYYYELIESLVFVNPFSMPPNSCLLLKSAFNLLNIIAILWLYLNYCRVTLTHQQTNAKLLIFFSWHSILLYLASRQQAFYRDGIAPMYNVSLSNV